MTRNLDIIAELVGGVKRYEKAFYKLHELKYEKNLSLLEPLLFHKAVVV